MRPERAVEILEHLVDGIHPLTGEALPEDNICEEPGIVEALDCAIRLLNEWIVVDQALGAYRKKQMKRIAERPAGAAPQASTNAGKPWLPADEDELLRLYKSGESVADIAGRFQRSKGGIRARLVRLGVAEHRSEIPEVYAGLLPIDNEDLRERLLHGETIPQLAQRYGRTEKAIRARLFYMGFGGSGPKVLPERNRDD